MATFVLQQSLGPLRSRLNDLGDSLFDVGTAASADLQESGEIVTSVVEAVGEVQTVFQRLDRIWAQLIFEDQAAIVSDWDVFFQALQAKLRAPCDVGHAYDSEERRGCASCRIKVKRLSDELKAYSSKYSDRLQPEIHFHSASSGPQDSKVLEDLAAKDKQIDELNKQIEDLNGELTKQKESVENTTKELEATTKDLESAFEEFENGYQQLLRFAKEMEAAGNLARAADTYEELHRMLFTKLQRRQLQEDKDTLTKIECEALEHRHNHVLMLMQQQEYVKAEPLAKQVWDRRIELLPANSAETRASYDKYCLILRHVKKQFEALRLYMYVWLSPELFNPDNFPDRKWKLEVGYQLALLLGEQKEYMESEIYHTRVWDLRVLWFPKDLDDIIESVNQIIRMLEKQGQTTKIDQVLTKAWGARTAASEEDEHIEIIHFGHRLGMSLYSQKNYTAAVPVLEKVWKAQRAPTFPADRLEEALLTASALVDSYRNLGDANLVEITMHGIHLKQASVLGPDHPDTLRALYNMGVLLRDSDKLAPAEDCFRRTWEAAKRVLKEDHVDTLSYGYSLGDVLAMQGKYNDAQHILKSVWRYRKERLGDFHPDTLKAGHAFGDVLVALKQMGDAEAVLSHVWAMTRKRLELKFPDLEKAEMAQLLECGPSLVACLMEKRDRDLDRVEEVLKQVVELMGKTFDADNPALVEVQNELKQVQSSRRTPRTADRVRERSRPGGDRRDTVSIVTGGDENGQKFRWKKPRRLAKATLEYMAAPLSSQEKSDRSERS